MRTGRDPITPLARPVALEGVPAADDAEVAERLHPLYRPALSRFAHGPIVSRGIPFRPPGGASARRWVLLHRPVSLPLGGIEASHLVLLHFCDAWRDPRGARPPGVPVGWVLPVGEPLARAVVRRSDGSVVETTIRRRFEVNEGIIGWGAMAFAAVPHLVERPLDWRGPHARQSPGRDAPPGHAGPLGVLPGAWGADLTGVSDNVPSATDDLMLWLHAIDVRAGHAAPARLDGIDLAPIDGADEGRLVVLAAITAYAGDSSPLRWLPRTAIGMRGARDRAVTVDLGMVARRADLDGRRPSRGIDGWGVAALDGTDAIGPSDDAAVDEVIELTAAPDAVLRVGRARVALADLAAGVPRTLPGGSRIEALPPADRRVEVAIERHDGRPAAARVRIVAGDGRVLPPLGHRVEVNPAIYEDLGADVILDGKAYAYVPGAFSVDIPMGGADLEVVAGMDVGPVLVEVAREAVATGEMRVRLGAPVGPAGRGWVSGDTHVHFLAPSTALLQARAEGVNVVHLLATQWGDHHTSVTDLGADLVAADGRHAVWVGSENRQNMLGHVGIVGTRQPVLPFASGGPPEGPIGGAVTHLMADWLRRCREQGGLAVGAHFPLPMAEVAADIDAGLLDALELQCFDGTLESPPIREWYRYLDAGERLPIVGGTDKMSAGVPLGQVRTWARLEAADGLTFGAWAGAVRAGRTFVSSGPLLELRVDGREPGETIVIDGPSSVEVELRAVAAQPIIADLELVVDGRVVAAEGAMPPARQLSLRETVALERSGWLAGRSRSPYAIGSAFATAMAAHTSPVYVERPGTRRPPPDLAVPLALIDGTRAWLQHLAPIRDPADLARFVRFLDEAERRLRERAS